MTAGVTDLSNQAATVGETEQVPQDLDVALDRCGDQNPFTADDRVAHWQAESQKHIRSQEPDTRFAEMAAAEPEPIIKTEPPNQGADQSSALAEPHTPSQTGFPAAVERMPPATAPGAKSRLFRKSGDVWELAFSGKTVHVKNSKGMGQIAYLLRSPGVSLHSIQLLAAAAGEREMPTLGSAGELLDPAAFESYRSHIEDLEHGLAEAERNRDQGRKEAVQYELDQLGRQLQQAVGLDGRRRTAHDDAEKIRKGVSMAISRAITAIREHHVELADHLKLYIKPGSYVCYHDDSIPWEF
jgi:hypothetical protein